jgi:hypothetical protein
MLYQFTGCVFLGYQLILEKELISFVEDFYGLEIQLGKRAIVWWFGG